MDTEELTARAEASLEGVTPGPWYTEMDGFGGHKVGSFGHETYDGTSAHCFIQQNFRDGRKAEENNARFIAASRQLVPDLIAALRAEREARERAEACAQKGFALADVAAAVADGIRQEAADEALERVAKMLDRKAEDYDREHGVYDYSTGITEYPGDGAEWIEEWEDLAAAIRSLKGGA